MESKYKELLRSWSAYMESGNNPGILSICDRLAELYEDIEKKTAREIYNSALISLSKINLFAHGISKTNAGHLQAFYESLSKDSFIVRDSEIMGKYLIDDYIKNEDYRLMFDQQDLRHILYNYIKLGFVDIEGLVHMKLEFIINYCLRHIRVEHSKLTVLIFIKGGDQNEIIQRFNESGLMKSGIKCLFAHSNSLDYPTSVRLYLFEDAIEQDKTWHEKLDEAVNALNSGTEVEFLEL